MDEGMGPLIIERTRRAGDGRHVCQIAWTTDQLRRIGQAVEEGDEAFLAMVKEAVHLALKAVMTPPKG